MPDQANVTLRVTHSFEASPERVFDGWIDPAKARLWLFNAPHGEIVRCDIDARPGGSFTIVDRRDGEDIEHVGEYIEVTRPTRLVFSFAVPKFSSQRTRVTIDIVPKDSGCELTLTHEGVLPDYRERTAAGWGMLLDGLGAAISSPKSQ